MNLSLRHCFGFFLILAVMAKPVVATPVLPSAVTIVSPATLAGNTTVVPAGIGVLLTNNELSATCTPLTGAALSKTDFFQLIGQSIGACEAEKKAAKQSLLSHGCTLVKERIIPANSAHKQLKKFSHHGKGSYKIIALYLPSRVRDTNENSYEVANLVGNSWWSSFHYGPSRNRLAPEKLRNIKFKSCQFKDQIINQCAAEEGCVDVFAQDGFQINAGSAVGVCATTDDYDQWGVHEGTYRCETRANGDLSVVLQDGNKIRVDTYRGVVGIGHKCTAKRPHIPSRKR